MKLRCQGVRATKHENHISNQTVPNKVWGDVNTFQSCIALTGWVESIVSESSSPNKKSAELNNQTP